MSIESCLTEGMKPNHSEKTNHFHALHHGEHPLLLSNVWDVGSALLAEAAGIQAIATTSAGISWSAGVPDGNQLDRSAALSAVFAIAEAVRVPVSADIEGGYAEARQDVGETVKALLDAGVVGVNIEDGFRTPDALAARIDSARKAADAAGTKLFINARTDVLLTGLGTEPEQISEAIARAERYLDAGADGIFVPGAVSAETVSALTAGITAPVNVMAGPGSLSVRELGECGAARISLGSSVAQAAYAVVKDSTAELVSCGSYSALSSALDYGVLNEHMSASHSRQASTRR